MFASLIKAYRKASNLSQEDMAYIFNISANHLSRIERNISQPSGELILRIIKTITNDPNLLNMRFQNTYLDGIILLVHMRKLNNVENKIVFDETMRLIELTAKNIGK